MPVEKNHFIAYNHWIMKTKIDLEYLSRTENFKKVTISTIWALCMLIFSVVIFIRIEFWARKQREEITILSERVDQQDYLTRQVIQQILGKQQFNTP